VIGVRERGQRRCNFKYEEYKTATKPADKLRYLLVADQDLSRQERLNKKWLTVTAHIRI